MTESFNVDADSGADAGYLLLRSLTQVQTDTCLRKVLKSGSKIYTPCRVALNENPKDSGGVYVCAVSINGNGRLIRLEKTAATARLHLPIRTPPPWHQHQPARPKNSSHRHLCPARRR